MLEKLTVTFRNETGRTNAAKRFPVSTAFPGAHDGGLGSDCVSPPDRPEREIPVLHGGVVALRRLGGEDHILLQQAEKVRVAVATPGHVPSLPTGPQRLTVDVFSWSDGLSAVGTAFRTSPIRPPAGVQWLTG